MASFWWVNQKQTFGHEFRGGYLWSPKTNKNGARNQSYEWMRAVRPGDVIFSYAGAVIRAVGVALSYGYDCPKPQEFGGTGAYWDNLGWRVDVQYKPVSHFWPKDNLAFLKSDLPEKFSPMHPETGNGSQALYLCSISRSLALKLAGLTDRWVYDLVNENYVLESKLVEPEWLVHKQWEDHIQAEIEASPAITETEKQRLVKARVGQGEFRSQLFSQPHAHCIVTRVSKREHLIASHIKPWRNGNNEERLDPENGLLLTPTVDHLFDKGFISFENSGRIIRSVCIDDENWRKLGMPSDPDFRVTDLSEGRRKYLDYHRNRILLATS